MDKAHFVRECYNFFPLQPNINLAKINIMVVVVYTGHVTRITELYLSSAMHKK